ncbi:MAG TPA: hypothetical protein VFA20_14365 [Myxococcaceae bacterium]|nr:hypothetical protein [Myxococcaceae bacterium]
MGAVARTMMLVAVAVLPGGFLALFAYVTGRALVSNWQRAAAAPDRKNRQPFLAAFTGMRFEDLAREARAVLAV